MRVFAAVDITNYTIIENIRSFQQTQTGKMVEPHNLHFTLRFLGDIPEETAREAADRIMAVRFDGFDATLRGVGIFGRPPRIVWVGTDPETAKKLSELAHDVSGALGGRPDKPFRPHLTILRAKGGRVDATGYADRLWGIQRVDSIKLKQSVLGQDGPVYSDLAEVQAG